MVNDVQKHSPAHPPAEGEGIGWLQRIIGYCGRNPLITLVAVRPAISTRNGRAPNR